MVRIQHEHTGGTQIDGHILAIALRLALLAHRIEAVADDAEAGLRIEVLDVRDERTPLGAVGKRDERAVPVRTLEIAQGHVPVSDNRACGIEQLHLEGRGARHHIVMRHGHRNPELLAEDRTLRQRDRPLRVGLRVHLPVVVAIVQIAVAVRIERQQRLLRIPGEPLAKVDPVDHEGVSRDDPARRAS